MEQIMIEIVITLLAYFVGVYIARELLIYYKIDKEEHKYMWLSWLTVFLFIIREP